MRVPSAVTIPSPPEEERVRVRGCGPLALGLLLVVGALSASVMTVVLRPGANRCAKGSRKVNDER